ncbi:DNA methyltransferase, partial [Acinetobacter baumannii]
KKELKNIFQDDLFATPKPPRLIEKIIQISLCSNEIILDSFAGSGTTAHAVLNLNKQDGGNRKFILIEMEDYANSITAERVKRV